MNMFIRDPYRGRPGYVALAMLLVVYAAVLTVVIAPDHVMRALDAAPGGPSGNADPHAGALDDRRAF